MLPDPLFSDPAFPEPPFSDPPLDKSIPFNRENVRSGARLHQRGRGKSFARPETGNADTPSVRSTALSDNTCEGDMRPLWESGFVLEFHRSHAAIPREKNAPENPARSLSKTSFLYGLRFYRDLAPPTTYGQAFQPGFLPEFCPGIPLFSHSVCSRFFPASTARFSAAKISGSAGVRQSGWDGPRKSSAAAIVPAIPPPQSADPTASDRLDRDAKSSSPPAPGD